jgi:plasmid stabilization system protein ParE
VRTVTFVDAAARELRDVVSFLGRQAPGRDDRFLMEVGHAVERLAENPNVGPLVAPGVRRLGLRRFPYNLVYEVQASDIYILAVAHQRRDPGYWQDRL